MPRNEAEPFVLLAVRRHLRRAGAAPGDPEATGPRPLVLSGNAALLVLTGFVAALLGAFVLGKHVGRAAPPPLATALRRYRAVQVTPLLAEEVYRERAWALRDLLVQEGFPGAEVLLQRFRGERKVRTIAGKVSCDDAAGCAALAARVRALAPRLRRLVPHVPIEIRPILILYRPPRGGGATAPEE